MSTYFRANVPVQYENCPAPLLAYLRDRSAKGLSPRTCITYFIDLRQFCQYIHYENRFGRPPQTKDEHLDLNVTSMDVDELCQVTPETVKEYFYFLTDYRGNTARTKNKKLTTLHGFYGWLATDYRDAIGKLSQNPVHVKERFKEPKKLPIYMSGSQAQRLLSCIDGPNSVRDYAIFLLFLSAGIRLSELVAINVQDLNMEAGTIRIRGKGSKERIAYPSAAAIQAIQDYMVEYRSVVADIIHDRNALFVSQRSKRRLSGRQIELVLNKYLARANLQNQGFSPHKLRHTAATMLANDGVDVQYIQMFLGHESLETTSKYVHMLGANVQAAVQASPLSKLGVSSAPQDEVKALEEDLQSHVC